MQKMWWALWPLLLLLGCGQDYPIGTNKAELTCENTKAFGFPVPSKECPTTLRREPKIAFILRAMGKPDLANAVRQLSDEELQELYCDCRGRNNE